MTVKRKTNASLAASTVPTATAPGIGNCLIAVFLLPVACFGSQLSTNQQGRLNEYAKAAVQYFTSPSANNLTVGFTHTAFGTGKYRDTSGWPWVEKDMLPETLSHVNINEVTLRFNCLAVAHRMTNWLDGATEAERYADTWGQILTGLHSLRYMQTNTGANAWLQYGSGTYHRTYWTTWGGNHDYPLAELRRDDSDKQSSDDNGLPFMNLLILEGLAKASTNIPGADKGEITNLCRQIRSGINLKRFVVDDRIVHEFSNGIPSASYWDRISAEGPLILAALWLSGQISTNEFHVIWKSLENHPVNWTGSTQPVYVEKPSYHAAMFIHGLRAIHGMPVTSNEYAGVDYFSTSLMPTLAAHMDFAAYHGHKALGSQVMSQTFAGEPMVNEAGSSNQARFPGNEGDVMPSPGSTLARATSPHVWFIPISRWRYLDTNDVGTLFTWMSAYEPAFFHPGSSSSFGWEAAIPWTPADTSFTWVDDNGRTNYTDHGRPYEALTSAYILLSIFDALNPDAPLASFSVEREKVSCLAALFDGHPSEFRLSGISVAQDNGVSSVLEAVSGAVYQAQSTTDIQTPSSWSNISGVVTSLGTTISIGYTNTQSTRYFRAVLKEYPPLP